MRSKKSKLEKMLVECCTTAQLLDKKVFPWRPTKSSAYVLEILRALKMGFKVGFYVGERNHGVWIIEIKELQRYLQYLNKLNSVNEKYGTTKRRTIA